MCAYVRMGACVCVRVCVCVCACGCGCAGVGVGAGGRGGGRGEGREFLYIALLSSPNDGRPLDTRLVRKVNAEFGACMQPRDLYCCTGCERCTDYTYRL